MSELIEHLDHRSNEGSYYTHRLLSELPERRAQLVQAIRAKIQQAHDDAKRRLRGLAGISLDPLGAKGIDPADGYPERLPLSALKGCFGEVLAGVVAESFSHFGKDGWRVPAYAFRFHQAAFHYLERLRQGDPVSATVPGRIGDDVLAFRMNEDGEIVQALVCEAKCTNRHDSTMIAEAHKKVSEPNLMPVDILQLVEILKDYPDSESERWKVALQMLYNKGIDKLDGYERSDLVTYVCGQKPVKKPTWIRQDSPHESYTADRRLVAVEIHLDKVDELVIAAYAPGEPVYVVT